MEASTMLDLCGLNEHGNACEVREIAQYVKDHHSLHGALLIHSIAD